MTRRIFCKVLLVVVAVFGLLVLSGVLMAQGRSQDAFDRVREVQERNTDRLMAMDGVEGTAVGFNQNDQLAVKVFTAGPGVRGIPQELDGVPVQVVVTGKFYALSANVRFDRPVPIGVSTGHPDITAGTIACRVKDLAGNVYALSNNHVYANSNEAEIGDDVIQPGTFDGGSLPDDFIGTLFDFEPIVFSRLARNEIDAAIALSSTSLLGTATPAGGYGTPSSTDVGAFLGQQVQKFGRTTELTKGEITYVNVTVNVGYGPGKTARFVKQIIVESEETPFIGGGDSGSLLVTDNADLNPVGLLFAGTGDGLLAVANRIDLVLNRFGVTVDSEEAAPPPEPPVLTTIEVSPATVTLYKGGTQQFTATGTDQYGDPIDTGSINWTSSDTTVGTISETGLFTANAKGTATVSATSGDVVGYADVTVQESPVLTTIEVSPATVTLYKGETQEFTATGKDQYEDPIETGPITWASSNTAVGSIDSSGLFTAAGAGTTTVSATGDGGVSGTADVTVTEVPVLTTIEVLPSTVTLYVGETQQFTATGKDQYGESIDTGSITWESSNEAVGTVDPTGLFEAGAEGTTTVSATSGGVVGYADVTVQETPAAPTAYVNIELSKQTVRSWWRVTAEVTITETDSSGPATVEATWSGAYSGSVSGTTDEDGAVSFRTGFIRESGTVTFTVNKVVKDGLEYILAGETSGDSISN
ncbi:MAG: Ig-like domain-containing protein [Planctomycetota bacterium]